MEILDWIGGALEKVGGLFPGVDMALVLGLIVILLIVRMADRPDPTKGKVKRLGNGAYTAIVAVLAFALAFIAVRPFDFREWIGSGIKHAGAASILYQIAKAAIPAKVTILGREIVLNPDKAWFIRPEARKKK